MDYRFEWHVPRRVLILKVSGDVSLEDLGRFNCSVIGYLEQGTAPVHLVSIGNGIQKVPTNLLLIKETVTYLRHPNMGWTFIVQAAANPVTQFIVSVAAQATGMKMVQVKNVTDGLEILGRLDQTVASDVAPV